VSTSLSKGQNSPLTVHEVVVAVQIDALAELSALLVTDAGKVRTDADFVFYNQPTAPGVRLQPISPGRPSGLAVSLDRIPADVAQIRVVITLDDARATFGRIAAPSVFVTDGAGIRLYEYRIDGLTTESIVIAVEFYRRRGSWKVRAVGQGYAGGFAALVTDHGVTVDDAPPPALPAAPAPSPSYPPPLPADRCGK
jgi:stress response protein SCP2